MSAAPQHSGAMGSASVAVLLPDPSDRRHDVRMFKPIASSVSALSSIRPEGTPQRATWNVTKLGGDGLFRLKLYGGEEHPSAAKKRIGAGADARAQAADARGPSSTPFKGQDPVQSLFPITGAQYLARLRGSSVPSGVGRASPGATPVHGGEGGATHGKPVKKSEKYYQALLKAERKRNERKVQETYDEFIAKAEAAAAAAARKQARDDPPLSSAASQTTESDEEEVEDDDVGPLVPYDGNLKLEIEIFVERAPGEDVKTDAPSEASEAEQSTAPPTASTESTPRLNVADELQALQEELGREEESEEEDGLPDGLTLNDGMDNVYSVNDPRIRIGIAGTVYFIPEAERYSLAPSLPPPPPPSLLGRRRLRIKPRLPLDISNHRYADEHVYTGPPEPADRAITVHDRRRFEQTLCNHDFYAAASKSLTQLPQLRSKREFKALKKSFGTMIDADIRKSVAWRTKMRREFLMERKEKEAQEAAAKSLEEKLAAEAAESAKPGRSGNRGALEGSRRRSSQDLSNSGTKSVISPSEPSS